MHKFEKPLERLYERILFRKPDRESYSIHLDNLRNNQCTLNLLEKQFCKSFEYVSLVKPLKREIEKAYELFLFRDPTDREIERHISHFRHECGGDDQSAAVIRSGSARPYLDIRPLNVEMDLTSQCNIRCVMCYFSHSSVSNRKRVDITTEAFERIAGSLFPSTNRLCLSLSTEPLIHRNFNELVTLAMKFRIPKVHLSTNGVLLDESRCEFLVRSGFHALNISLDGATKATFERLKTGARFEAVIGNINTLNRVKERHESPYPVLSLSFVMMNSNIHELPDFIRLASELKVGDVHVMHMVPYKDIGMERESLFLGKERCNEALGRARTVARGLHVNMIEPGDFPMDRSSGQSDTETAGCEMDSPLDRFDLNLTDDDGERGCCPFPWHFIGIDSFGMVMPCGWWFKVKPMGNIYRKGIIRIWKGRRFNTLRKKLIKNKPVNNCRICPSSGLGMVGDPQSFSVHPF